MAEEKKETGAAMAEDLARALLPYGIDYDDALYRFGGNAALYRKLALKYLADEHYIALTAALETGDYDEAYAQAHSLKGVAGNLSLRELYLAAGTVSDALRLGETTRAESHMPAVDQAHKRTLEGLELLRETPA